MEKFIFLAFILNFGLALQKFRPFHFGAGDPLVAQKSTQLAVESGPAELYFTQKLDHFKQEDNREWQQRYWQTNQFYFPQGPIFLWINGQAEANPNWIVNAQYLEYAQKLGAMAFSLEHRFYGRSRPLPDTSTENLWYYNTEQAIADIANFIRGMNQLNNLPRGTKWFVFGGSYAGQLAAWARLKYPDVIHGAVASSAPLFAKLDFKEYYDFVRNVLASYKPECPKVIEQASKQMQELDKTEGGRQNLTKLFKLYKELKNDPDDISRFYDFVASFVASVTQYNRDNVALPTKDITIETICDILTKGTLSPIKLYAELNDLMLKVNDYSAIDTGFHPYIDDLKLTDYESAAESSRQAFYQSCNEFGYFQTSGEPSSLFGATFRVEYFVKQCETVFGERFNRQAVEANIARTNQNYGGFEFTADRTVFVHGAADPWSTMGITQAKYDAPYDVIMINAGAHCVDVYSSTDVDSFDLIQGRMKILELLVMWMATP